MDTKSFGETMSLTKENIATMLAIIGKEEKNATSPTAIVMLSGLKDNLKILFDKLCRKELDFCMIRMGRSIQMDDNCFEYAKIERLPGVTKTMALANFMNGIQQYAGSKHIEIISSEETPLAYEFLIMVRDY